MCDGVFVEADATPADEDAARREAWAATFADRAAANRALVALLDAVAGGTTFDAAYGDMHTQPTRPPQAPGGTP